jgi:steroid 5-alpha reductase family enzyme
MQEHECACAADFQKDWFKRQPGNGGEFVRTGFYYFCQFPNYFAEIAVWWTMFFWAGFPNVFLAHPWILISPLFTTVLLRYGSGVANLAEHQRQRYGHREDYREYVASTPVLLPFMKPFYAWPSTLAQPLLGNESDPDGNGTDSGAQ